MTDMWDNNVQFPEVPKESTEPAEEKSTAPEQEPAAPAEETTAPVQEPIAEEPKPQQPPVNSWSSDGSYRYVPPRAPQQTPPQPPYQQQTQPPQYGGYNYNPNPQNGSYGWPQPPVTPQSPKPPKKKGNGWIALVAVLGAVAVVASLVLWRTVY